jgi:hypothetical protein
MNIVRGIGGLESFRGVNTASTNFKRDLAMYLEPYL